MSTKAETPGASSSIKILSGTTLTPVIHDDDAEPDSQPLNFDTFVPTHDPSLDIPSDPTSTQIPVSQTNYVPVADASVAVSQDEAFSRALSAMYWGGYWTAMYHVRQNDHPFFPPFFHVFHLLFFRLNVSLWPNPQAQMPLPDQK